MRITLFNTKHKAHDARCLKEHTMNSKTILTISAIVLFAIGVVLNFMPQELANKIGFIGLPEGSLLLQIMAGFFLGFGILNWMLKDSAVGGVYGKPLGLANLLQFGIGAFALGRAYGDGVSPQWTLWLFLVYLVLALAFAWLVFLHDPNKVAANTST
jgi:energy-converting hydrogenase Eha subunit C